MCDQSAPQRNGIQHAQDAAQGTDQHGGPIGKPAPPAHDHEAGQNEDDGGESSRRRGNRLDDIVFLDGDLLEPPQHRHGDDGRRDRRRKGQPRLEAEEHVCGREYEGDQDSEDQPPDGQFFRLRRRRGHAVRTPGNQYCYCPSPARIIRAAAPSECSSASPSPINVRACNRVDGCEPATEDPAPWKHLRNPDVRS
jgi:hypothetical protein